MGAFEQLNRNLSIIEEEVLKAVHLVNWAKTEDGSWGNGLAASSSISASWERWRKQFEQFLMDRPYGYGGSISDALAQADQAARFKLNPQGAGESRWKVIFKYEEAFCKLRKYLDEIVRKHDEIAIFKQRYQKDFGHFYENYGGNTNVFVAINYGDYDDVSLIRAQLDELERTHARLMFHIADERTKVDSGLYVNLMFYIIACDAGLVFFTKSNAVEKTLHNPNVAFEFGAMSGLGRKCQMVRHASVEAFTDVVGLLHKTYTNASETKEIVRKFIQEDLGVLELTRENSRARR